MVVLVGFEDILVGYSARKGLITCRDVEYIKKSVIYWGETKLQKCRASCQLYGVCVTKETGHKAHCPESAGKQWCAQDKL